MGDTNNLVQGQAVLYTATVGSTEPEDAVVMDVLGGDWTDVGLLKNGVRIFTRSEFLTLWRDKRFDPSDHKLMKREVFLETNLAEHTLENLKLAMNGGTITEGDDYSTYTPATEEDDVDATALIIDGFAPGGFARRIIVRSATQIGNAEFKYSYNQESVYHVRFALQVVEGQEPYKVVDQSA